MWSSKLETEIREIGEKSRKQHKAVFQRYIDNPEMIGALNYVHNYWKYDIRSALVNFSYSSVGGKEDFDVMFSEFFSIGGAGIGIHDDIIDMTIQKRGKRTLLGEYGLPVSLVIGDLLIVKGFTFIADLLKKGVDRSVVILLLEAYEVFFSEMCTGEILEIKANKRLDMNLMDYDEILWKLGVDSEYVTKIGAIVGGGSKEEIKALSRFGRIYGYLCRLHDELDDVLNIGEKLDYRIEFESMPLSLVFAAYHSKYDRKIISGIINRKRSYEDLVLLLGISKKSGAFDYINELSTKYVEEAIFILKEVGDNEGLWNLEAMIRKLDSDIKEKI